MIGPGKYDHECTEIRERVKAEGVALIVLAGDRGSGFAIQGPPELIALLPAMLEQVARSIRQDMRP